MPKSSCNNKLLDLPSSVKCDDCVSYSDGKCDVDRPKYDYARKELARRFLTRFLALAEKCKKIAPEERDDGCKFALSFIKDADKIEARK